MNMTERPFDANTPTEYKQPTSSTQYLIDIIKSSTNPPPVQVVVHELRDTTMSAREEIESLLIYLCTTVENNIRTSSHDLTVPGEVKSFEDVHDPTPNLVTTNDEKSENTMIIEVQKSDKSQSSVAVQTDPLLPPQPTDSNDNQPSQIENITCSIKPHHINIVDDDEKEVCTKVSAEDVNQVFNCSETQYEKLWNKRKRELESSAEIEAKKKFHQWKREKLSLEQVIDQSLKPYVELYEAAHALRLQFEAEKLDWMVKVQNANVMSTSREAAPAYGMYFQEFQYQADEPGERETKEKTKSSKIIVEPEDYQYIPATVRRKFINPMKE